MTSSKRASCAKPWCSTLIGLCIVTASASMMGCASSSMPQSLAVQPPPADLAAPCPDLPALADGSAKTVALWIVDTAAMYRDCSARHAGLVRAWTGQKSFSDAVK